MDRKKRHLQAIEAIDRGLREAEQITIEDGIREGIKAGRLSQEVGEACLEAYRRTSAGLTVVPDPPAEQPGPGWTNGVVRLKDPVEHGWEPDPGPEAA